MNDLDQTNPKNSRIKDILKHLRDNIDLFLVMAVGISLVFYDIFGNPSFEILAAGILFNISFLAFSLIKARTVIQDLDETANRLTEKELSPLSIKMQQLINLDHPDLRIFDSHKNAMTRYEMISMAKKQVRILSTNLFTFFHNTDGLYKLFQEKLESGCKFQIIIYTPDSSGIREKQWEEGDLALQTDIISSWQRYLGPAVKKFPQSLEIKFVRINLSFAATIIDDKFMFVSLNIPGGNRRDGQTPRFEIENTHELFNVFTDAFEKVWNDHVYVTPSIPKQLEKFLMNA